MECFAKVKVIVKHIKEIIKQKAIKEDSSIIFVLIQNEYGTRVI